MGCHLVLTDSMAKSGSKVNDAVFPGGEVPAKKKGKKKGGKANVAVAGTTREKTTQHMGGLADAIDRVAHRGARRAQPFTSPHSRASPKSAVHIEPAADDKSDNIDPRLKGVKCSQCGAPQADVYLRAPGYKEGEGPNA